MYITTVALTIIGPTASNHDLVTSRNEFYDNYVRLRDHPKICR